MQTDLSQFDNSHYQPGSLVKRVLWYVINGLFFHHSLAAGSFYKVILLRLFGATVGKEVVIKPGVNIKYPWRLSIGDYTWIGEATWIDNLAPVRIGNHVCISQGAMLLTGNHDYRKPTFDLIIRPIVVEDGSWIGAKSVVCPGITCHTHCVLSVGSVATSDLQPYRVYQGNPARELRHRLPT